jgi:hypothetical protein
MAKDLRTPTWKMRMAVVTLVCTGFLLWMGYYIWNFEYHPTIQPDNEPPEIINPLRPTLRVADGTEFQSVPGVCVSVSLVNIGRTRLRLMDTQALMPLYAVAVLYHAPGGAVTPAPMTAQQIALNRAAASASKAFDRETDSLVELVPGASLSRVIPLWQLFDLRELGKYDVTITYQPGKVKLGDGVSLADMALSEQSLTMSSTFEVPLRTSPPPEPERKKAAPAAAGEAPKKGL